MSWSLLYNTDIQILTLTDSVYSNALANPDNCNTLRTLKNTQEDRSMYTSVYFLGRKIQHICNDALITTHTKDNYQPQLTIHMSLQMV